MTIFKTALAALIFCTGIAGMARAEAILTAVVLNPGSPNFSAHGEVNPTYPARTYVGDPDIWTIDMTGYAGLVDVTLKVDDNFTPYPDDYDLYWNGSFLGNTLSAINGFLFQFTATNAIHQLRVEYVNIQPTSFTPSGGGSWYDMWITTARSQQGGGDVPAPATWLILLAGLAGFRLMARRKG